MENINNIPIVDSSINKNLYRGLKVKIKKVYLEEVVDYWTGPMVNGRPSFNPTSTEIKKVLTIETEEIPELDKDGNPTGKKLDITIKRRFNLKKIINKDNTIQWVIPKTPRSLIWQLMTNLNCQLPAELVGKEVVLTTEMGKDGRTWLKIVI